MNISSIKNQINNNDKFLFMITTILTSVIFFIYYGILTTALIFFGIVVPLYNITSTINQLIPTRSFDEKKAMELIKWNIIMINYYVLNFISNLLIYFNPIYIQMFNLLIILVLYKFNNYIITSYTNDTTKQNLSNNIILTDIIMVVNKYRSNLFLDIINKYKHLFNDLNLNISLIETINTIIGTEEKEKEIENDDFESDSETINSETSKKNL